MGICGTRYVSPRTNCTMELHFQHGQFICNCAAKGSGIELREVLSKALPISHEESNISLGQLGIEPFLQDVQMDDKP